MARRHRVRRRNPPTLTGPSARIEREIDALIETVMNAPTDADVRRALDPGFYEKLDAALAGKDVRR